MKTRVSHFADRLERYEKLPRLEKRLKEEIKKRIVHVKRTENMQQEIERAAQCCNELEEMEQRLKEESESLCRELIKSIK